MAKSNDDVLKELIHMRRHIMNYIPTTLDNSLSYYELLGKILDYMVNNIGGGFTEQDIIDIIEKWVSENDIFTPRGVVEFTSTEELLSAQDGYYTSTGTAFPDATANYFTMVFHNQESVDSEKLADIFAIDAASATIWYLNNGGEWTSIEKFGPRGSKTFDTIAELQVLKDGYYTGTGNAFPITDHPYFVQVYHTATSLIDIFATDANTSRMYYLTSGGEWTLMFDGQSTDANWRYGGEFTGTLLELPDTKELVYYHITGDTPIQGMGVLGGYLYSIGQVWFATSFTGDFRYFINNNRRLINITPSAEQILSNTLNAGYLVSQYGCKIYSYSLYTETNFNNSILHNVLTWDANNMPFGIAIASSSSNDFPDTIQYCKVLICNFSTEQLFIAYINRDTTYTITEIGGAGIFKPQGTTTFANITAIQNAEDGYYTASGAGLPTSSDNYFLQVFHSTENNQSIVDCYATNSVTGDMYYLTSGGAWSQINFNKKWSDGGSIESYASSATLKTLAQELKYYYGLVSGRRYYSPASGGGDIISLGNSMIVTGSNLYSRIADLIIPADSNTEEKTLRLTSLLLNGLKTTVRSDGFIDNSGNRYNKRFAIMVETFDITNYNDYLNTPFYNTGIINLSATSNVDLHGYKISIPDVLYSEVETASVQSLNSNGYDIFFEVTTNTLVITRWTGNNGTTFSKTLSYGCGGFHETPNTIAILQSKPDGYYTMQGGVMPTQNDAYLVQIFHTSLIDSGIVDVIALNSTNGDMYYLTSGGTWTKINASSGGGVSVTQPTITSVSVTDHTNASPVNVTGSINNGILKIGVLFNDLASDNASFRITLTGTDLQMLGTIIQAYENLYEVDSNSVVDISYQPPRGSVVIDAISGSNTSINIFITIGLSGSYIASDYYSFMYTLPCPTRFS